MKLMKNFGKQLLIQTNHILTKQSTIKSFLKINSTNFSTKKLNIKPFYSTMKNYFGDKALPSHVKLKMPTLSPTMIKVLLNYYTKLTIPI